VVVVEDENGTALGDDKMSDLPNGLQQLVTKWNKEKSK
jgi:hypothetical protein